jgi:two-component system, NtrC family, sensor kinase
VSESKRFYSLILIMAAICLSVSGISIRILYGTAIEEQRERLTETAQSQASLIAAIDRFDNLYSKDYPN